MDPRRRTLPFHRVWPALLLCAGLAVSLVSAAGVALAPGDQAPALSGVIYPDQQRFRADWSANELTLVNFWATWCEPCRQEMPLLDALHVRLQERGFQVVGAFERWEVEKVADYLADVEPSYTIIRPDAIVDHYWGGIAIKPTSFLVDASGRILRKYVGAMPEQTEGLVADVEAVLDGRQMPTQVVPEVSALPEDIKRRLEKRKR